MKPLRLSPHRRWILGLGTGLLAIATLRLLPFILPIRASDLRQDDRALSFVDRNGLPLGTLLSRSQEQTLVVPIETVSPNFIAAIIAAEDQRFYQHDGVDGVAIARAIREALRSRQIGSGASTITMQLARLIDPKPRTPASKLREIWTAWRLEAGMTKPEILSAYLNRLPMGGNLYGIEAAARHYFGIPASDLNLDQATLLAALPNDPVGINPYSNPLGLRDRQRYILDRLMATNQLELSGKEGGRPAARASHTLSWKSLLNISEHQGQNISPKKVNLNRNNRRSPILISPQQFSQLTSAKSTAIALQLRNPETLHAPHFLFWLADQLTTTQAKDEPQFVPTKTTSQPPLPTSDFRLPTSDFPLPNPIRTSLDQPLQTFVQTQVRQVVASLAAHNVNHAAALVIENRTGQILAYVGSPGYFRSSNLGSNPGSNSGNPQGSNDGVQALRQPGSALKPFLYELALRQGVLTPNAILSDRPTHYALPHAQVYSPVNYSDSFQGSVRLRLALANSLNIPAIRTLEQLSVPVFLNHLRDLGFTQLHRDPEYYGLGLALGSGEVSLWELARAYVWLARGGRAIALQPLVEGGTWRAEDGGRRTEDGPMVKNCGANTVGTNRVRPTRVHSADPEPCTEASPQESVRLITDMLADPYARSRAFGIDSVLRLPFPAAVKTGTSSGYRDTWTAGYTTDYTVATWVGNFNGDPMQNVSGVTGAAPLWHRIMLHLYEHRDPKPFPKPTLPQRSICATTGLPPQPNCKTVVLEYVHSSASASHLALSSSGQSSAQPSDRPSSAHSNPAQRSPLKASSQPETKPLIQFPQEGDRFLLESTQAANHEQLQFQFTKTDKPMQVLLNGRSLPLEPNGSYWWSPQPGNWHLEVQQGQQRERIHFRVEVSPPHRDGFRRMTPKT